MIPLHMWTSVSPLLAAKGKHVRFVFWEVTQARGRVTSARPHHMRPWKSPCVSREETQPSSSCSLLLFLDEGCTAGNLQTITLRRAPPPVGPQTGPASTGGDDLTQIVWNIFFLSSWWTSWRPSHKRSCLPLHWNRYSLLILGEEVRWWWWW